MESHSIPLECQLCLSHSHYLLSRIFFTMVISILRYSNIHKYREIFFPQINDLSGRFSGNPDFRSILFPRSVGWSRFVRVNALIGPIRIVNTNGIPYVNQHLHWYTKNIAYLRPVNKLIITAEWTILR